jgi:hypothetical protein
METAHQNQVLVMQLRKGYFKYDLLHIIKTNVYFVLF